MKNTNAMKNLEALGAMLELAQKLAVEIENDGDFYRNTTVPTSEVAEYYFKLRTVYDEIDACMKRIYHVHDMMNKHLIPELLARDGVDSIRVPSIARSFSTVTKTSATMVDKALGFDWLRSIGQGEIIQETVNASTLSALCRNLVLEQGIDPPAEAIKLTTYNTTSMVKYRPKEGVK